MLTTSIVLVRVDNITLCVQDFGNIPNLQVTAPPVQSGGGGGSGGYGNRR